MRGTKVALSLAAACLFAAAVYGSRAAAAPQKGRASAVERGRAVYADKCARCHGADGRGETRMGQQVEAPDISDPGRQRALGPGGMIASVTNGRGQMPAFKKRLTRRQIADSIAYVRTLRR